MGGSIYHVVDGLGVPLTTRYRARCDRQQPCNTCLNRGLASSCAYSPDAHAPSAHGMPAATAVGRMSIANPRGTVQGRIQELERLVVALMQQQQQQEQHHVPTESPSLLAMQPVPTPPDPRVRGRLTLPAPTTTRPRTPEHAAPSPSTELGRISPDGVSYVGGSHWAAVLDSIAELKDHFDRELDGSQGLATVEEPSAGSPVTGPMLLYGSPKRATQEEILASVPPRPVVDRLISKYFNTLDMAPGTYPMRLCRVPPSLVATRAAKLTPWSTTISPAAQRQVPASGRSDSDFNIPRLRVLDANFMILVREILA